MRGSAEEAQRHSGASNCLVSNHASGRNRRRDASFSAKRLAGTSDARTAKGGRAMTIRRAYLLIVDLIFVFVLQALQPSLRAQSVGGATTPGSFVARDTKGKRPIPDVEKWYPVQL